MEQKYSQNVLEMIIRKKRKNMYFFDLLYIVKKNGKNENGKNI